MKKSIRKTMVLSVMLVCTMFLCSITAFAETNGAGNITNGGYAYGDGEYVFYSADKKLYRADEDGGNKKVIDEDTSYGAIAVDDDYIFYHTFNLTGGYMYKSKISGGRVYDGDWEWLISAAVTAYTQIEGEYMYYRKDDYICRRIAQAGTEAEYEKLAKTSGEFVIYENRIYFDNDDSKIGAKGLASIKLDGSDFKSLGVGSVLGINVYKGNIYFVDGSYLKKVSIKGGSVKKLCEAPSYINVYDGYVYFRNPKDNDTLARISTSGGDVEESSMKVNYSLCIVNDIIYSRDADGYSDVIIKKLPKFSSDETKVTPKPTKKPASTPKPTSKPSVEITSSEIERKYFNMSDWARPTIEAAEREGLIPDSWEYTDMSKEITRLHFSALAVHLYEKLANVTVSPSDVNPFEDLWHIGDNNKLDILRAYKLNIAIGTSDDTFEPLRHITREELATMLCRVIKKYKFPEWNIEVDGDYHMSGSSGKKFADDAEISDYARNSVYFMSSMGIVQGMGNNEFAPKNTSSYEEAIGYANATCEQAVVMAYRIFCNKNML